MVGRERRGAPATQLEDKRGTVAPRGRRRVDHFRVAPGENWYRDVILLVVCIFVYVAVTNSGHALKAQKDGRRIAIQTLCGATNAVIDAGRIVITGGATNFSPQFVAFLQAHGYPTQNQLQATAKTSADKYAAGISKGVVNAAGVHAKQVVSRDGRLLCNQLVKISAAK